MRFKAFCASLVTMIVLAGSAWAHHSPSAIFDMKKKVNITGTLTEVNWVNPHIVIMMDVKKDGATEAWKFESNPPAWFRQVGVSRNDMAKALNQTVTVEAVIAVDRIEIRLHAKTHAARWHHHGADRRAGGSQREIKEK